MTVTVVGAAAPRRRVQGRHTVLVIGGELDAASWATVLDALRAAIADGANGVVLDIAAVQRCDREALLGLIRVRGRDSARRSCIIDVVGARWAQFVTALTEDPPRQVETTRAMIRELRRPYMIDTTPRPEPARW